MKSRPTLYLASRNTATSAETLAFSPRPSATRPQHVADAGADGSVFAASLIGLGDRRPNLALLVSCVGRKLVMKQRIEEEIEAVRGVCGDDTSIAGFYSYGELCPFSQGGECRLHNQTITITALAEA